MKLLLQPEPIQLIALLLQVALLLQKEICPVARFLRHHPPALVHDELPPPLVLLQAFLRHALLPLAQLFGCLGLGARRGTLRHRRSLLQPFECLPVDSVLTLQL